MAIQMTILRATILVALLGGIFPALPAGATEALDPLQGRWSAERAWAWYDGIGPIRGCNYLPRTAVNSTEVPGS